MELIQFKKFIEDFNDIYFYEFELLGDFSDLQSNIYQLHSRYLIELSINPKMDIKKIHSFCGTVFKKLKVIQDISLGKEASVDKKIIQDTLFDVIKLYHNEIDNAVRTHAIITYHKVVDHVNQRFSKGGKKSSSIYDEQRKESEKIYQIFKKEHPDLIKMFRDNPRKNKPKTELKKALNMNMKMTERTLQNWAKKLLQTDGVLIKNEND